LLVENFLTSSQNRTLLLFGLIGLILITGGIFFFKSGLNFSGTKVEILNDATESAALKNITAEIAGAVITPGVYKLANDSRVDDLLILAGGFSSSADRTWTDKYLNRASVIADGQKIYIPNVGEQTLGTSAKNDGGDQTTSSSFSSDSNAMVNVNTASLNQLDSLPGIGQVYGQNIIEHRPYSTGQELVSKGAIKQSLYEKIKDRISVY